MSTAAHEPRRVGSRPVASPSASKVTPRRNASDAGEPVGMQYDSDEVPVLIRLPDLRAVSPVETRPAPESQRKRKRSERQSASKQRSSQSEHQKVGKKPVPQQAGHNKLVIAGVVGGVLVVAMLFLFNAGGPKAPVEQDGWSGEITGLEVEMPGDSLAGNSEPPALDFEYAAPEAQPAQLASGKTAQKQLGVPDADAQVALQPELLAPPRQDQTVTGWPSDETMEVSRSVQNAQSDLWPGESLTVEQGGNQYPPTNSPSERDYRSGMYPSGADSYRMGKLDTDRLQSTPGERSGILDGNIAIPDINSFR